MSLESFYGGRMGASFVIVERFDGINIPQEEGSKVYAARYLAVTNDEAFYIYETDHFIQRDEHNYTNYNWKLTSLDGSTVDTKSDKEGTGVISQQVLDIKEAEGMVQCFAKGGDSTDIVNYGEYVIIDTSDKNNPDNGKVFRRGMNFDLSEDNPLAGAEYIGQIVGPQGETVELDFDHYDIINENYPLAKTGEYEEAMGDLVPGSYIDGSGVRQFEDRIRYIYTTIKDEFGNVKGCLIGFKLPTLVQDFEATSISPYENRHGSGTEEDPYVDTDLIYEDPEEFDGSQWKHSFYQKWQIKIPHGYHGVNSTNIEIIHTKTMPRGYKEGFAGTAVYVDEQCVTPFLVGGNPLVLGGSRDVLIDPEGTVYHQDDIPIYNTDENVISCRINYNGQTLYVRKEDCYVDVVRYKEISFDNLEEGEITYHYIGEFNSIQRITISDDGTLTVYYSGQDTPQNINQALTWITDVSLNQQGDFLVLFNNNKINNGRYYTSLDWIDLVTVDNEGTMTFYYNSNHDVPAYRFEHLLEVMTDIDIQTESSAGAGEGSGDQRVHVAFNTGRLEVIGNPLNYIVETVISKPSVDYPNAPYSHLLVYYADPALRQTLQAKWVTYPSEKESGLVRTEWVDLGDVRGAAGGLHILEDVDDLTKLQDAGTWIPPEQLTDGSGVIINPEGAGWAVTYTPAGQSVSTIYCYDYNSKIWYPIGQINPGAVEPNTIIVKSAPVGDTKLPDPTDVMLLKDNGFWLASGTMYFAE